MGQDLLCKLNAIIHLTPDGLFLTIHDDKALWVFPFLQSTNDFCIAGLYRCPGSVGKLNGNGMTSFHKFFVISFTWN